jgi:uncharacterized Zn-binding protein involved in type VI secretion
LIFLLWEEKRSGDVKINGHNAAVMGSVSEHDHAVHHQLPGTIKFDRKPSKEGEVTGGTGKKVKINGKEAAVIGSQVTTCNDMEARNNSVIMAAGASMPMPVIINPKNTAEWEAERGKKEPKFTVVRWGASQVKEGEEAEVGVFRRCSPSLQRFLLRKNAFPLPPPIVSANREVTFNMLSRLSIQEIRVSFYLPQSYRVKLHGISELSGGPLSCGQSFPLE